MELAKMIEAKLRVSKEEAERRVTSLQWFGVAVVVISIIWTVTFFWPGGGIETVPVLVDSYERGGPQLLEADGVILTSDRLSRTSEGVVVTIQVEGRYVHYTVPTDSGQDRFTQLLPDFVRYEIQPGDWEIVGNAIEARYTRFLYAELVFFLLMPLILLFLWAMLVHDTILTRRTARGRLSLWRKATV